MSSANRRLFKISLLIIATKLLLSNAKVMFASRKILNRSGDNTALQHTSDCPEPIS